MQEVALPRLKTYNKKFDYSYAMGIYPVLELIRFHAQELLEVIINPKGSENKNINHIKDVCLKNNIPYLVDGRLISKLAFKENTYAIGVFRKYSTILDLYKPHVLLDQPRNMGNVGTIIRAMLGFGINNLAVIRPATDIYDPKVISSSMGAFFQVKIEYFKTFSEYSDRFPRFVDGKGDGNLREYYPFMLNGSKRLESVKFTNTPTLIMGNESKGLAKEYENVGVPIFIPHSKEIDSLNLSIATSIALWEFSKQI